MWVPDFGAPDFSVFSFTKKAPKNSEVRGAIWSCKMICESFPPKNMD